MTHTRGSKGKKPENSRNTWWLLAKSCAWYLPICWKSVDAITPSKTLLCTSYVAYLRKCAYARARTRTHIRIIRALYPVHKFTCIGWVCRLGDWVLSLSYYAFSLTFIDLCKQLFCRRLIHFRVPLSTSHFESPFTTADVVTYKLCCCFKLYKLSTHCTAEAAVTIHPIKISHELQITIIFAAHVNHIAEECHGALLPSWLMLCLQFVLGEWFSIASSRKVTINLAAITMTGEYA